MGASVVIPVVARPTIAAVIRSSITSLLIIIIITIIVMVILVINKQQSVHPVKPTQTDPDRVIRVPGRLGWPNGSVATDVYIHCQRFITVYDMYNIREVSKRDLHSTPFYLSSNIQ